MKATGIVRRIDDLGRIVIPKEIRRTLRIREGDALEIFTDAQGGVIFKKYSPVGELSTFAAQYAEVLNRIAGLPMVICDRDHVVAAAGVSRKEYLERRVTPELEECVQTRRTFAESAGEKLIPVEGIDRAARDRLPHSGFERRDRLGHRAPAGGRRNRSARNQCKNGAGGRRVSRQADGGVTAGRPKKPTTIFGLAFSAKAW